MGFVLKKPKLKLTNEWCYENWLERMMLSLRNARKINSFFLCILARSILNIMPESANFEEKKYETKNF